MSKTQTTLVVDERVLQEAERIALARHKTLDQLVEEVLQREVSGSDIGDGVRRSGVRLPTHGHGGLLPGVDLADKDQMDHLLSEP